MRDFFLCVCRCVLKVNFLADKKPQWKQFAINISQTYANNNGWIAIKKSIGSFKSYFLGISDQFLYFEPAIRSAVALFTCNILIISA